MELIPITKPLYSPKQNSTRLYYKKNVYHRKKLMNSLSNINNKNPRKKNIIENESYYSNFSNIRSYITKEEQYNISNSRASINITFKTNINCYSYKNINKCSLNTKSIILIQKFVRGFLAKKKFKNRRKFMKINKKKNKNYLTKININSIHKHVNKSSNINILDAIKQNSFRQKNTIKYVNNMLNNNRHSVIEKCKINNKFKNNLLLIPKGNKNYSLDHMKYEENEDKDYKTYRDNHKNNIFKKPIELIDKKNNITNLLEPEEASFYISNKRTTSKPIKDIDSIEFNFNEKKMENNIENNIELSDLTLSSEQCPQNINKNDKINEDEVQDSDDEIDKNLNINNEYFENENKNIVKKTEKNTLHNNKNLNNLNNEKSNKYKGIPYIKITSNTSSNPTKENTSSDKILENEINNVLDNSRNKNSIRTIKAMNDNNNEDNKKHHKKHKSKSKNKNKEKNKDKNKDKEKNKEKDKEKNDKKKHKKHSKTKSNTSNNNNNNFNYYKKLNFDSKNNLNNNKVFPYNINFDNKKQNILRNMCLGGINNNFLNNKNDKIKESIKEEKQKESDTNDIKSSFYDNEDFAIISYDYSLNDKRKKLAINNVVSIIIKGGINKMKFIKTLESVIRKNIYHYIFNYLKGKFFKNDEEDDNDDSSMTINDSCSFIPCKRIEKKNIIFEYAKTDITKKKKVSPNNRKINIQRNLINGK